MSKEQPLTIGEFARMTHLSVKALRHYHDLGVLIPRDVDGTTGYRRYDISQVATAQVVRRLRELDMPLDELKQVLSTDTPRGRNAVITAHLARMERQLDETKATVASLRALLDGPRAAPLSIEYRRVPPALSFVIRERVSVAEFAGWWASAFKELRAALRASRTERVGADAAVYAGEFFEEETGEVLAFIPVRRGARPSGRVELEEVPSAELAMTIHEGSFESLDQAYAALGAYVAERAIGVEGPIREYYLVTPFDTKDVKQLRTEVGWPVFATE